MLVDGRGYRLQPATEEELMHGLQDLDQRTRAEDNPRIVEILSRAGDEDPPALSIGVGGDEYVLVFNDGGLSGDGAYSRGPREGDMSEVWFAYGDSDSEYQKWMLVDRGTAFDAAREFFRTGSRPTNVDWEEF
jgi:hypothetical protein